MIYHCCCLQLLSLLSFCVVWVNLFKSHKRKKSSNNNFLQNFYAKRSRGCNFQNLRGSKTQTCTLKVAFKIASEANYVHILSGQKFIKNAKNGTFWQKKIENLKCDILSNFNTLCFCWNLNGSFALLVN